MIQWTGLATDPKAHTKAKLTAYEDHVRVGRFSWFGKENACNVRSETINKLLIESAYKLN